MNRAKTHVHKGDIVEVISGGQLYEYHTPDDPSQPVTKTKRPAEQRRGRVLAVFPAKSQVLVEGLRMIKKHQKKSQQNQEGGIVEREGPIHISNLRLVSDSKAAAGAGKKVAKKRK